MCRIKHQSIRWYCDSFDSSGIDTRQNIITTDIHISPDNCKHAAERGYVNLGYSKNVLFHFNEKIVANTNRGKIDSKYHNECSDRSWIHLDTFESYLQNISLTANLKGGTINNWQQIPLPCPVYENRCETTSLDPFAYTWTEPENCIFSVLKKFDAKMIQNEENYYFVKDSFKISNHHTRGRDTQQFMLKILNKTQSLSGHPKIVYPTLYGSLFIACQKSFNMDTDLQKIPSANTGIIHSEPNLTYVKYAKNRNDPFAPGQMDYEAHLGTKLVYILFRSFYMLRTAELALLTNQCELERSMFLNTSMLSIESPRLAGFILTQNRSVCRDQWQCCLTLPLPKILFSITINGCML